MKKLLEIVAGGVSFILAATILGGAIGIIAGIAVRAFRWVTQ